MYSHYVDQIIRRCIPENEMSPILQHCHSMECGGHFGEQRTISKVLKLGFFFPSLFKDAQSFVKVCDKCQRMRNIVSKNEMPLNSILEVELFDVWVLIL